MILEINHVDLNGDELWGLDQYLEDDRCSHVREEFLKKLFRVNSEDISYRTLNHWEKMGLIPSSRKDNKGWRKFNLVEIVWIEMAITFREMGFSLRHIKQIKERVITYPLPQTKSMVAPELEFSLFQIINDNQIRYLVIYADGSVVFANEREFESIRKINMSLNIIESYIVIPLNPLLEKFMSISKKPDFKLSGDITSKEFELLKLIRSEKNETLNIILQDGSIKHIKSREFKNKTSNIASLIRSARKQDILIKIRNGEKVSIEQEIYKTEKI